MSFWNNETAVSLAALILADDGLEITPDKLQTLLQAAGVHIEPIWSTILPKALEGKDVNQILTTAALVPGPKVAVLPSEMKDVLWGDDVICCVSDHSQNGFHDADSDSDIGMKLV
ncbi:unnamed protein product [Discula destructiva]